jgi:predicted aspartyl protease
MAQARPSRQRQADLEIDYLACTPGLWPDPPITGRGPVMRFFQHTILLSCSLAVAAFWNVAQAADCKPLQFINSVKLESFNDGNGFLVPVEINGTPKKLVLDTGGATTSLTQETVKALGLKEESSRLKLYDLYGNVSNSQVAVKTFDMGNARGENLKFQVSPMKNLEAEIGANGLLSTDLFLQYDIDMDFGASRLNYFSQDHCEGQVTYWPERPVSAVPVTLENGHINIPVMIDGHNVRAIIDTGAESSVMNVEVAMTVFGISPGAPDTPLIDTSKSDPLLKEYDHKFGTLSFEGITVENPKIHVITDRMGASEIKSSLRGTLSDPYNSRVKQLVIGMNILKHLHLYMAYQEKKLYISPAGSGESVLFKSAAAPAN